MRQIERRTAWIDVPDTDTTQGCRVCAWMNHPNGLLKLIDTDGVTAYLAKVLVEWEGYDMTLSQESLDSLSIAELTALGNAVAERVRNP